MARNNYQQDDSDIRFPHPRGDGPSPASPKPSSAQISPPAWGWPGVGLDGAVETEDFPTRVGMARFAEAVVQLARGFPHPRGDGPKLLKCS